MLFDAITATKREQAGIPDLDSEPTARQMKAVTWIAAGSRVLSLLSVHDLRFAPWLGDITTLPAQSCLMGVWGYFFQSFCYLTAVEKRPALSLIKGQLG